MLPIVTDSSQSIESDQMSEEIDKFALFLHQLQEKIDALTLNKNSIEEEISEYQILLNKVKDISEYLKEEENKKENNRFNPWEIEGYKTLVDIGNHCYVQGVISKEALAKSIFVHIGLGFHTEIKLEDIPAFSFQRIAILERKRSKVELELQQVQNDHREAEQMYRALVSLVKSNNPDVE